MSNTHTLVLLRHGQSRWNLEDRFTGWAEVDLTDTGRDEARHAAGAMRAAGLRFDAVFTSVQQRAIESLEIVQEEMRLAHLPAQQAWQLNERHYGCLQGLNKADTARRLGADRVTAWRRSYSARPPALEWDDHRHPRFEARYAGLPPEDLPCSESLADTLGRLLPCWQEQIAPAIREGQRVLIVAHGNSLRALIQHLEATPEINVPAIRVPTGIPIVYILDGNLHPVSNYNILDR